jgi:large subunit ribosomal protein L25
MSELTITAETGRAIGTGPSRRVRADGRIPGVVYGAGQPSTVLSVDRKELRRVLTTAAGTNALLTLEVEGQSHQVIIRELQRHPVRREVTHVDFFKVDPSKPIEVQVPVRLVGEAREVSTNGGITEQRIRVISMRVRPDAIPDAIDVDITDMTLDRSILVKDVELPDGCVSTTNPQQAVVTAQLTRAAVNLRQQAQAPAEA